MSNEEYINQLNLLKNATPEERCEIIDRIKRQLKIDEYRKSISKLKFFIEMNKENLEFVEFALQQINKYNRLIKELEK